MPKPSKAPKKKAIPKKAVTKTKSNGMKKGGGIQFGRFHLGISKATTIPKYPIGTKVTLKSEALGQDYPPITGTVKGYQMGNGRSKLLVQFGSGKGLTAVKPSDTQAHWEIGGKKVALKAGPLKG